MLSFQKKKKTMLIVKEYVEKLVSIIGVKKTTKINILLRER